MLLSTPTTVRRRGYSDHYVMMCVCVYMIGMIVTWHSSRSLLILVQKVKGSDHFELWNGCSYKVQITKLRCTSAAVQICISLLRLGLHFHSYIFCWNPASLRVCAFVLDHALCIFASLGE